MTEKIGPPAIINVCVVRGQCPANCRHCPVGLIGKEERIKKFGKSFMDISDFKRFCEQVLEFGDPKPLVRIHGVGEPALWPKLKDAFLICESLGLRTWVFTVGLGKSEDDFIDTFKHASIVEFSINAKDADEFSRTKGLPKSSFEEIVKRMEKLYKTKKNGPPRILISRVQSKKTKKDHEFVQFWKKTGLADDVFIRSFHDYGRRIDDKDSLLRDEFTKEITKQCLVPTARMNVDGVLGVVVRCFNELFDEPDKIIKKSVGNPFKDESLKDIWNGEIMNNWRENTFSYPECAQCRSCQPPNPNTSEKQLKCI